MNGELKLVLEISGGITALAAIVRNGVVVARFIAFLSDLKETIERIAASAERALGLAEKANANADKAVAIAEESRDAQQDTLRQILDRLDERDATARELAARDERIREQESRLERKVIQP